ncbi:MAG: hypothetical protein LUI10_02055 [Lachnospiraceae bacterium]|nr:hypothetical protein [Lachnospiraceae bacterium]
MGLLFAREIMSRPKFTYRKLMVSALFIVLVVITRSQSTLATVAYILIFVLCARDLNFKKIAKLSLWLSCLTVAFIVASAYLGIIDNYKYVQGTRIRYYLGFRYSLFGPAFLFNITGLFLYLKKDGVKWIELLVLSVINYWMFAETDSRLSFYLSLMMIILFAVLKLFPKLLDGWNWVWRLLIFSFLIGFAVSVGFTALYDSSVPWQKQLNKTLESRLSLGQQSLQENGVNLFGQDLTFVGNGLDAYGEKNTEDKYNYVDSFYIQIMQRYGLVFITAWICLLTVALYHYYKLKDYHMMICLSMIAAHCIVDDLSLSLHYNTFWFALTVVFSGMKKSVDCVNIASTNDDCTLDDTLYEIEYGKAKID